MRSYHGVHSRVVFRPSLCSVYLVEVTGILPSVSPLRTDEKFRFAMLSLLINSGTVQTSSESYLKTHTLMPPRMSFRMTGRTEAGASFQRVITSLLECHKLSNADQRRPRNFVFLHKSCNACQQSLVPAVSPIVTKFGDIGMKSFLNIFSVKVHLAIERDTRIITCRFLMPSALQRKRPSSSLFS